MQLFTLCIFHEPLRRSLSFCTQITSSLIAILPEHSEGPCLLTTGASTLSVHQTSAGQPTSQSRSSSHRLKTAAFRTRERAPGSARDSDPNLHLLLCSDDPTGPRRRPTSYGRRGSCPGPAGWTCGDAGCTLVHTHTHTRAHALRHATCLTCAHLLGLS